MRLELIPHLLCLGLWFGCVAVEAVVEAVGFRHQEARPWVARMHYWIDLFVELPALTGVIVTGLILLPSGSLPTLLAVKIAIASLAMLINAGCLVAVVRRWRAIQRGEADAAREHSNSVYLAFVVGLPAGGAAFFIGLHLLEIV